MLNNFGKINFSGKENEYYKFDCGLIPICLIRFVVVNIIQEYQTSYSSYFSL